MRDISEIRIRGRLAQDAKFTDGDNKRTNLRVMTNVSYKRQDDTWGERTAAHSVTVWGRDLSALKKGQSVEVEGELEMSRGKRQDGVEVDFYSIRARPSDVVVVSNP